MGAITPCQSEEGQYISNIFLVPKPNGKFRFILNLKSLNNFVSTSHFKMEDLRTSTRLIHKDCFMTTIDLKESYLLIPVAAQHRKYLRFKFKQLYEFTALPYGLCTAPSVFTKILKPVMSYIRNLGYVTVIYLDDIQCIARTYEECQTQTHHIIQILECLGFILNYEKSNLKPSRQCKFLGFIINSQNLTIKLPSEKEEKVIMMINQFMSQKSCKIRKLAQLLGTLTAACPAIPYGWRHTKLMEREKYLALQSSNGNFESLMNISHSIIPELEWWLSNIPKSKKSFSLQKIKLEIFTDASLTGWGAHCLDESIGGLWNTAEKEKHINYLELLAAYFGLRSFAKNMSNCHILLRIDNTTAISCINKMGSIQFMHLNTITQELWQWC